MNEADIRADERQRMDEAYFKLSLRTGVFAGAVVSYLGKAGAPILQAIDENQWSLSPKLLETWQQEALGLGLRQSVLDEIAGVVSA